MWALGSGSPISCLFHLGQGDGPLHLCFLTCKIRAMAIAPPYSIIEGSSEIMLIRYSAQCLAHKEFNRGQQPLPFLFPQWP